MKHLRRLHVCCHEAALGDAPRDNDSDIEQKAGGANSMTYEDGAIRKRLALAACVLLVIATAAPVIAQENQTHEFDIEEKELGEALTEFGIATGSQVLFKDADVRGKTANGLEGVYTSKEAIKALLENTGVAYRVDDNGTLLVGSEYVRGESLGEGTTPAPFRAAQVDREETVPEGDSEIKNDDEVRVEDTIVVTGTLIRGLAPESSPVQSFFREDILNSGAATAQGFIQTLPQNFSGGSNETNGGLPNNLDAAGNVARGSSVNLRGLGSGSTLVLLNGRRMSPSSVFGDFVDISVIPASAIERVDIMTDGASSIYGADAVAGVVNFILRDDYEGVEASARYGSATEGSLDEFRGGLTGGTSWGSGNLLAAYEFLNRTNLSAGDRNFSNDAPLPTDLQPSQQRRSGLLSLSQDVTPFLELSGDVNFSSRETEFLSSVAGTREQTSRTDALNVSFSASWDVLDDWVLDFSSSYSRIDLDSTSLVVATGSETSNEIESDLFSSDLLISGDLVQLPAGSLKFAAGGHFRTEDLLATRQPSGVISVQGDREVYALYGEVFVPLIGPETAVPGVRRLEVNLSGRYSDFSDFGDTTNPKIGLLWSPVEHVRIRGSYSESFNPPALGRAGANDLSGTAYPTALFNLLLGLTPGDPSIANVTGLAISGTARDLGPETSSAFTGGVDIDRDWGAHRLSFSVSYFDIEFEDRIGTTPIPNNRSENDAPNIAFNNPELFPEGTVIFNPTVDQINEVIATLATPVAAFPGSDPLDAAFINFAGVRRNQTLNFVEGIDFDLSYSYSGGSGVYNLGLSGTYLSEFQQQAASTTPLIDVLDTQFNPVSLRLRGTAGYSNNGFSLNMFVNHTDSYKVDSTPDAASIDSWTTVDLNLAYDFADRFGDGILKNTQLRVSLNNLFDENPPSTPDAAVFGLFGYDPTNASPFNRFVSLEVIKEF